MLTIQMMKKLVNIVIVTTILSISISLETFAQYPGCEFPNPSSDPGSPNYCPPVDVPLDENIIYLIIPAVALGIYGIKKKRFVI